MPTTTSEATIERAVCKCATAAGWVPLKLNGPGDRGKPDRLFLGPGGQVKFIEFKRPGGRVRPLQHWFLDKITEMGHEAHIIDNKEEGCALFE